MEQAYASRPQLALSFYFLEINSFRLCFISNPNKRSKIIIEGFQYQELKSMALNYQDPQSNMLYGNQPLQGGVVYNQNPGWLAILLSGIKNVGAAVGQGALDAAPYFLNSAGNSNSLPTSVVQNNPYNASDTPAANNPNNFKIQNAHPYSSPLQQAYDNLQTVSSPKPQLAYATLSSTPVQRGLNGLVGVQMSPAGFGSQAYSNFGQSPLLAQAPPLPSPKAVQKWSDAVPNMGMSSPNRFQNQARTPHYAGYPQQMVALPVAQLAQGDQLSELYGYPRRGKQGESGAAYQMIQGTLPSNIQMEIYRRNSQQMAQQARAKEAARIQKLREYYGPEMPDPNDRWDWRNITPIEDVQWHRQYALEMKKEHQNPEYTGYLYGLTEVPPKTNPLTVQESKLREKGELEGRQEEIRRSIIYQPQI
jgi:hypothetical protein